VVSRASGLGGGPRPRLRARARAHFDRARDLAYVRDEDEWLAAHASAALAPLTALLGGPERALALAEETIAAARHFAIPSVLVMALARAGETAILTGMHGRAAEAVNELLGLLRDQATRPWVADALEMAALVLEAGDDVEAATAALQSAEAVRLASGGSAGGTRALADAVHHAHDRLLGAGPAPAGAGHSNSTLSVDVAISRAVAGLEALSGARS
jgi:tetratricopeptide (TPR) repeat protein